MPTGAELFVDAMERLGLSEIFTLVGDHLNEVLVAAARRGIRIVDFRHESGVTHAADTWARLRRAPALALVTGGPGHTNALTGIATAHLAGSPLIAVSGSRASTMGERQAFQDIDQAGMVRPVVKWSAQVPDAGEIPFYLGRAYSEAVSGRMGAVHLTIPVDAFRGASDSPSRAPSPAKLPPAAPTPDDVERALALLRNAARPVVIAGSGVWWARAEAELPELVERTSLPVYTITFARGVISDRHPLCMGSADPALNKAVHRAFQEADVFLVLGKRIDYRLALGGPRLFPAAARFIQVDIHPQELGMNRDLELGICADVKATLSAFLDALGAETWPSTPWLERLRGLRVEWETALAAPAADTSSPLHPAVVYFALKELLPAGALYSWDGADFGHWGRAILPAVVPGGWIRLGPLGTIGAALPNAIALQLANPGKPVVLFTGDGSLGFYLAELDTLVRHGLPVVVIVGNDAGWGLERELQKELNPGEPVVACELRDTRYDLIMQGFGGGGETVETLEEIAPAVDRAFRAGKPYLLNVRIRGARSPFTEWQIGGKKRQ
jgi:acetolactate synthase-1/2/3 large subunit